MTESTANTEAFDITLEDAGPARKRISVSIPADAVADRMASSLGTLQSQAQLPGFRKGKAPRHLLERRFGTAMKDEAIQNMLQESYQQVVEEHQLAVLGEAEIDGGRESLSIEEGRPFEFSMEVDILPEIDFPELGTIEIIRPLLEVEDEQIDLEIERQCLRAGKAERLEGDLQPLDRMLGALVVTAEGESEPLFTHDQSLVVLPEPGGKGQILGMLIDDMYQAFEDLKVGDTTAMEVIGPEGHEREDFRGKKLRIEFTIHLAERVTPLSPQELIEQFNLGTEEVLREQIRLALEQRRDEEQAAILRRQGMEKIVELVDVDLPERASSREIQRELDRMRQEMTARGDLTPDEVEVKLAELREDAHTGMRARMKNFFILQRLAMHFNIQVSENEINSRIMNMAMQRGLRPDHVRSELAKAGQLPTIGAQVRDDKAADAMVAEMSITDMPAEEWAQQEEQRAGTGGSSSGAKKATTKKAATKKTGTKKTGTKKAASKKPATKKASSKKAASKKPAAKKSASKKKPS